MIKNRFLRLSEIRLGKMLEGFGHNQADSIRLLPLLFHTNYPMLPGFVDKETPCGIQYYYPTELEKKIAKTVSRSFKFQARSYLKFEIAGLYLMGSMGTLGQSIRSDLDLWICLVEYPDPDKLKKLERKIDLITSWIKGVGVELNCYLVHQDDFHKKTAKQLTKESCGDTQNFLLLDEFYRTSIWLCGRMPLWWLIPPDSPYSEFAQTLLSRHKIEPTEWMDFGNVVDIPAHEYFSAALWQLYKAVESPYKSAIKLLTLEIYASQESGVSLLSSQYKNLVYSNQENYESFDPYLLMLECAEAYLQHQGERLEFLRRAFYLKVAVKVELNKENKKNWRYQKMFELVNRWRWSQLRLDYLNDRINWRINAVVKERKDLVKELIHSYHFLANFVRKHHEVSKKEQEELVFLGRKFHSMFERKPGKIDRLNNGIAKSVVEVSVTLFQKSSNEFFLYLGALAKDQLVISQPCHRAQTFFEVIAWGVGNGVINGQTGFQVYADEFMLDRTLAQKMVDALIMLIRQSEKQLDDSMIQKPQVAIRTGVFLGEGFNQPPPAPSQSNYAPEQVMDYFSFGDEKINRLNQFDIFYVNSWGEYHCKHFEGEFAWVKLYLEQHELIFNGESDLCFVCRSEVDIQKLTERINELFRVWNRMIFASLEDEHDFRYVMSLNGGYLVLEFSAGRVNYKFFKHEKRFLSALGDLVKLGENTSALVGDDNRLQFFGKRRLMHVVDGNLRVSAEVRQILENSNQFQNNCYLIARKDHEFDVYVTTSDGSLFYQSHSQIDLDNLSQHYVQFFDMINQRMGMLTNGIDLFQFWFKPLDSSTAKYESKALFNKLPAKVNQQVDLFHGVKVIVTRNFDDKLNYELCFDTHSYSTSDYKDLAFRKLVKALLNYRKTRQNYPVFVTELDLSVLDHTSSTISYLEVKRSLEQKLNRILAQLLQKK